VLSLAAEQHGLVKFGGLPVPGATVTASVSGKTFTAITDQQGAYSFVDLPDGVCTIEIEMLGFEKVRRESAASGAEWELKMLPLADMHAVEAASTPPAPVPSLPEKSRKGKNAPPAPTNTAAPFQRADLNTSAGSSAAPASDLGDDVAQKAADGFLINGTANNGASSPFSMAQAFGNSRKTKSLYSGYLGVIVDNSTLDARPFSLTGQDTPKLPYDHLQGVLALGGPIKIPHLIPRDGPMFFLNYQWTRNRNDSDATGLVPTAAERNGQLPDGTLIPKSLLSPQAQALLRLYPLPNFAGGTQYNYQIPIIGNQHQDSLQTRVMKTVGRKNQLSFLFAMQSTRSDTPNLFQFLDTTRSLGINLNADWRHSFSPRFFSTFGYQFSRLATRITPYFENRENVSANAGIGGNNQEPVNWGPPTLNFSGGTSSLTDALPSHTRYQTSAVSVDNFWGHRGHNLTFGGDFRRQEFNLLSQQDPRGAFTFNGAAAGSDLADFLLGIPDTSSIAFGNADKYFRSSIYEAYVNDDWRLSPALTLNLGVRWEYWPPLSEKYGRLVNLDISPGFSAENPVVAANGLIHPDKHAVQPRVAFAWRPFAASSMVVRGGYGVYYNTSVYLPLATQMAQQSPLSKSLSVQNSPNNPLTLADGFTASPTITPNTFAVDPNFRLGYSQNWQLSVQRDLPGAMVLTVAYQGSKGTRAEQIFLPNTYPAGAVNPCPACPAGFEYVTSNGNSTREAGQIQLRRRLRSGLTGSLQYTYSKSIDDAALGGRNQGSPVIAQNWLDLDAERGLSNFDQRHLLNAQIQYTTGMGLAGGTLLSGWKGALFKEWTFGSQITAGTGLPLTPIYLTAVNGTGVTGSIRPDYTGASVYAAPQGLHLNPAAYTMPASGEWGDVGRNTITGPAQFTLNASLGRVFQMTDRLGLDFRIDATNALNNVTYPNWNTTVSSAQFGLPTTANPMRSLQTTVRLRF